MKKLLLTVLLALSVNVFADEVDQCGVLAQNYLTIRSKSNEDQKFYEYVQSKLAKVRIEKRASKVASLFYTWAYDVDFQHLTQSDRITICRYLTFCVQSDLTLPDALKEKLTVDQFSQLLSPVTAIANDP